MEQALAAVVAAPVVVDPAPVPEGQVYIWVPGHPPGAVQADAPAEDVIPHWALVNMPAGVLLRYGNAGGLIWIVVKLPNGEEACFILFVQAVLCRCMCALHPQTTRKPGVANLTVGVDRVERKLCHKSWGGNIPLANEATWNEAKAAAEGREEEQNVAQAYSEMEAAMKTFVRACGTRENPVVVD